MSLSESNFEFPLRKAIKVTGESDPVSILVFKECVTGYDDYYLKLRRYVTSAQMNSLDLLDKFQKFAEKRDGTLRGGKEITSLASVSDEDHENETAQHASYLEMILGSTEELEKLVKQFGFMVGTSKGEPICETENGMRVKEGAWADVHVEDKIKAAIKYCSFFGIGLDNLQNKDSDPVLESPSEVKEL